MKKILLIAAICAFTLTANNVEVMAETNRPEPVIKIEVPADEIKSIDVNYKNETPSATSKALETTKKATKKTIDTTKEVTEKTVTATKKVTKKTVDGTKDIIDNLNPNKPVTVENLQKEAAIKTLKNERNELKSAYNSRIKDINAKIKATQNSTTISTVEKQDRIYNLNKQKAEIELQRDNSVTSYNLRIQELKTK